MRLTHSIRATVFPPKEQKLICKFFARPSEPIVQYVTLQQQHTVALTSVCITKEHIITSALSSILFVQFAKSKLCKTCCHCCHCTNPMNSICTQKHSSYSYTTVLFQCYLCLQFKILQRYPLIFTNGDSRVWSVRVWLGTVTRPKYCPSIR